MRFSVCLFISIFIYIFISIFIFIRLLIFALFHKRRFFNISLLHNRRFFVFSLFHNRRFFVFSLLHNRRFFIFSLLHNRRLLIAAGHFKEIQHLTQELSADAVLPIPPRADKALLFVKSPCRVIFLEHPEHSLAEAVLAKLAHTAL